MKPIQFKAPCGELLRARVVAETDKDYAMLCLEKWTGTWGAQYYVVPRNRAELRRIRAFVGRALDALDHAMAAPKRRPRG